MQPFLAAFTLNHWLAVVCAVANTTCTITGETATVCRRRSEAFGARRAIECVGKGVVTAMAVRCRCISKIGRDLGPTLVVRLESVL